MTYMLDTNIAIYAIKNRPGSVIRRLEAALPEGLCISAITLAELRHGVVNSAAPGKNEAALLRMLSLLQVLPFDDYAAIAYGSIRTGLQRAGTPIGPLDMLIAAHALSAGLTLVTNNTREFARVPGLRLENWVEE